jgi:hypothetical protein
MNALLVILASPFWGTISAQLCLHGALAVVSSLIYLFGVCFTKERRSRNLMRMFTSLGLAALCAGSLYLGHTAITDWIGFHYSGSETIVYWLFSVGSVLWMLPQIPAKLGATWRHATLSGGIESTLLHSVSDQALP